MHGHLPFFFDDVKQGSAGMTFAGRSHPGEAALLTEIIGRRDKVTSQELHYTVCKKQNLTNNMTCIQLRWLDPVYIKALYLPSLKLLHT